MNDLPERRQMGGRLIHPFSEAYENYAERRKTGPRKLRVGETEIKRDRN